MSAATPVRPSEEDEDGVGAPWGYQTPTPGSRGLVLVKPWGGDTLCQYFLDDGQKDFHWAEHLVEELGHLFREAPHFCMTASVLSFLDMLLPKASYFLNVRVGLFLDKGSGDRTQREHWNSLWRPNRGFIECLDRPLQNLGLLRNGDADEDAGPRSYYCNEFCVWAVGVHSTDAERVDYYLNRLRGDPMYIPTALLYAPSTQGLGGFGINAVLLDGHHKLQACVELGRPIRFLLAQNRAPAEWDDPAFPWAGTTARDVIIWAERTMCEREYIYQWAETDGKPVPCGFVWPEDEGEEFVYQERRRPPPVFRRNDDDDDDEDDRGPRDVSDDGVEKDIDDASPRNDDLFVPIQIRDDE